MSDQPKQPRRLTAVLNDPSAAWSEIRSATLARTKTQGGGAVTNHAFVKSLSSSRKSDDHPAEQLMNNNKATDSSDDEGQAAKDDSARSGSGDDKLMPLGNINNRRASLSSQSSSRRSVFRHEALRRQSLRSRRASLESVGKHSSSSSRSNPRRGSSRSTFSDRSITITPTFNCSTNSINIMDFGVSNRALSAALDESRRSFSSLDDDILDELDEELYGDGNEEGWVGSRSGLLVSWRSCSLRSMHSGDINEQPTRSEGDLDDYQDTNGFMDWPSVADGANDTIQEEHDPIKTEEEWNIEDYEQNIDDTVRSGQRRSNQRKFLSQSLTKSLRVFDRSSSMESSFSSPLESSFSSQEGITDLIKQKLLNTKNKHQQLGIEAEEKNEKKKPNLFRFTSSLRRSSSDAGETNTNTSQEAIWVRESDDPGEGEQYRNIYAAATANKSPQTQRKNLFSYF